MGQMTEMSQRKKKQDTNNNKLNRTIKDHVFLHTAYLLFVTKKSFQSNFPVRRMQTDSERPIFFTKGGMGSETARQHNFKSRHVFTISLCILCTGMTSQCNYSRQC